MPNIGPTELLIVLVIVLLVFGPKRLPSLGKSLGSGLREFKDSIGGNKDKDEDEDEDDTPSITQAVEARNDAAAAGSAKPTAADVEEVTPEPTERS
jgi:sec-independent protein translocase protein TatA